MATTLQLLQGPTKALVGSALSGLAADLALSGLNPALCYVHRPAYDDEAFQSIYGSPKQRALATPKPKRLVGAAALVRLGTPGHLAVTFGRNVGLTTLVTVNRWLLAALEEEEAAEAEGREPDMPPLELADLAAACNRGAYNACVDLAVQATRALLDARALEVLPADLAKKLVKDLRQSVARKGRMPWYLRAPRVAKTAAYSEATWWTADFLVSCAQECYTLLLKAGGSWPQRLRRLVLRCGLHAVRASLVLGAVSLGNGAGAAMPRFRGLSMWLASLAASFAVNGYVLAFMNRWVPPGLPSPPPAGGPAGAAVRRRQQQQQQQPQPQPQHGAAPGRAGIVLVGQAVHPAALAAAAAAAGVGNGPVAAEGAEAAPAAAAAPPAQQQEAGVQAGVPDAAEPPIPAPQQRRVVGGPRLPERPARRHAGVGPDAPGAPNAGPAAAAAGPLAPPPAAPATPQFRTDQRAPTPAGDSEEAEARAAAGALSGGSPSNTAGGASGAGASSSGPAGQEASSAASPAADAF